MATVGPCRPSLVVNPPGTATPPGVTGETAQPVAPVCTESEASAVTLCATWDNALACEVGRAAQLVKGYGDVRRRMVGHFDRLLEAVMRAAQHDAATGGKFETSRSLAARYRTLVLQGPESEAAAAALATEGLARS